MKLGETMPIVQLYGIRRGFVEERDGNRGRMRLWASKMQFFLGLIELDRQGKLFKALEVTPP